MTIKKSILREVATILGGLMLLSLLVLVAEPVMPVDAAVDPCGDGVCEFNTENNDLCPEDCHYCSQSRVSTAEIDRYPLADVENPSGLAGHTWPSPDCARVRASI